MTESRNADRRGLAEWLATFGAGDCREGSRSVGHDGIDRNDWEDYIEVPVSALMKMRESLLAVQPSQAQAAEADGLTRELLDTLQMVVKHFTKTPSTLADSQARGKAHEVIAKAYAAIGYVAASPVASADMSIAGLKALHDLAEKAGYKDAFDALSKLAATAEGRMAASPVASEREGDLPKLPSHIITAIIDYGNSRADRRDGEANSDLKYAIGAIRSLLATRTGSDK